MRLRTRSDIAAGIALTDNYTRTEPAWHDAPTCEGLWATVDGRHASAVVIPKHELSLYQKTTTRWFGPIPEDKP